MYSFLKTHPDAATAAEALRRSTLLRTQGLATPSASLGSSAEEVLFEHIEGCSGSTLLHGELDLLLKALAQLHRAEIAGLPVYDPFLRIRPRLRLSDAEAVRGIVQEVVPTGSITLHGDLHVGQFIGDQQGSIWIVDLDDLAIGPAEADLANFTAHLATSDPHCQIAQWSDAVCTAWTEHGHGINTGVFDRFLRFSLVRRHLKLREAGRPDFEAEVLTYLRESAQPHTHST